MVNQGSGADVMYLDLFKGLGLKNQDLMKYDTTLVSFDGRVVIPEDQIFLLVNMEGKEVMVTFIVVSSFSPYTEILRKAVDSCGRGCSIHIAREGQISYRIGRCYSLGKSANGQIVPSCRSWLEGQVGRTKTNQSGGFFIAITGSPRRNGGWMCRETN